MLDYLSYVSIVAMSYGFFMLGYYFNRRQSLKRLGKCVGKPMSFEILFYVINGKKL